MIYIGEQGNIVYDETTITEEQKNNMVGIKSMDDIPIPDEIDGKIAVLRANIKTKELYYVYEDVLPEPEDEQTQRMNQFEQNLDSAILELTLLIAMQGGM